MSVTAQSHARVECGKSQRGENAGAYGSRRSCVQELFGKTQIRTGRHSPYSVDRQHKTLQGGPGVCGWGTNEIHTPE